MTLRSWGKRKKAGERAKGKNEVGLSPHVLFRVRFLSLVLTNTACTGFEQLSTRAVATCTLCEPISSLSQAAPNDIQRLWTAIDRRIQALKRGQDVETQEKTADKDHNADDEEESKTEPDDELKGTEPEDDDDSVKDRCEVPDNKDESSNDSCPTGEGRGKETVADDD